MWWSLRCRFRNILHWKKSIRYCKWNTNIRPVVVVVVTTLVTPTVFCTVGWVGILEVIARVQKLRSYRLLKATIQTVFFLKECDRIVVCCVNASPSFSIPVSPLTISYIGTGYGLVIEVPSARGTSQPPSKIRRRRTTLKLTGGKLLFILRIINWSKISKLMRYI